MTAVATKPAKAEPVNFLDRLSGKAQGDVGSALDDYRQIVFALADSPVLEADPQAVKALLELLNLNADTLRADVELVQKRRLAEEQAGLPAEREKLHERVDACRREEKRLAAEILAVRKRGQTFAAQASSLGHSAAKATRIKESCPRLWGERDAVVRLFEDGKPTQFKFKE